jgi:hypothetical protein
MLKMEQKYNDPVVLGEEEALELANLLPSHRSARVPGVAVSAKQIILHIRTRSLRNLSPQHSYRLHVGLVFLDALYPFHHVDPQRGCYSAKHNLWLDSME